MQKKNLPTWIQHLFLDCSQEFPREQYQVEFLGPSYTDATRGPTSLTDAVDGSHQKHGMTWMCKDEKRHTVEVSHRRSMYGPGYLVEIGLKCGESNHVADVMSVTFYMEEFKDLEGALMSLGIDVTTLWAGDDSYEP